MNEDNFMSPVEGAELAKIKLGKFWKKYNPIIVDNPYVCMNCEGNTFFVENIHEHHTISEKKLECSCDQNKEYAAVITLENTESVRTCFHLEIDHHFNNPYSKPEIENEKDDEEIESDILCESCFKTARDDEWQTTVRDNNSVAIDSVIRVFCENCSHEIEFGWSHPDQGGRIWPCESKDFNPWKTWPEERYRNAWEERGWIHPSR